MTYNEWLQFVDMGLESARKQKALELKISAAESQDLILVGIEGQVTQWTYGVDVKVRSVLSSMPIHLRYKRIAKFTALVPFKESSW